MFKFGTKNTLLRHFWARIFKVFSKVFSRIFKNLESFAKETILSKFVTKNALFKYFLGKYFLQILSYLKSPSNLSICKISQKNPKMPYFIFGYFWARIPKTYCDIWNQHLRICLNAKFCEKMKMPKFGSKYALFGYFWTRILKNYCDIWKQHPQISQKWVFNR